MRVEEIYGDEETIVPRVKVPSKRIGKERYEFYIHGMSGLQVNFVHLNRPPLYHRHLVQLREKRDFVSEHEIAGYFAVMEELENRDIVFDTNSPFIKLPENVYVFGEQISKGLVVWDKSNKNHRQPHLAEKSYLIGYYLESLKNS